VLESGELPSLPMLVGVDSGLFWPLVFGGSVAAGAWVGVGGTGLFFELPHVAS